MSARIAALAENHRAIEALLSTAEFDLNALSALVDARQAMTDELGGLDGEALEAAARLQARLVEVVERAMSASSRRLAAFHDAKRALDAYRG